MNELQALLSPTSFPCNNSTDPTDVQLASLQLTVVNISQTLVDLTDSGLRIEFVVDPGGVGSASALILSQYSADQSATGSPTPAFTVEASAALGTAWTITPAQDAPCAFLAIPQAGAGQLAPNLGPGQPPGSVSFVFANIAADLVPGASPVTVTVLAGSTASVAETPLATKTGPGLAITSFTATPLELIPPSNQSVLTWSTLGAATCELIWNQDTTAVVYNGETMTSPWTAPPEVTAEAPATATLFQDTQFTLIAQGMAPVTAVQVVNLAQPAFNASADTVTPYAPFTLYWSCFDRTGPTLTWQSAEDGDVTVTSGSGMDIAQGTPLDISGSATVTVSAATTFNMHVAAGRAPLAVQVSVKPVTLSPLALSNQQVIAGSPDGQQTATFTWTVQNATGLTLSGGGRSVSLPYDSSTATVELPPPEPRPILYTIMATGFNPGGVATTVEESLTVVPIPVGGLSFNTNTHEVTRPRPVTLSWNASAATGFTIASSPSAQSFNFPANVSQFSPTPWNIPTTTYTITAHGYTGGNPEPSATVTITVVKQKEKEKEKEKEGKELFLLEKQPPDRTLPPPPADAPSTDLPSGTQQAFIRSDERPSFSAPDSDDAPS